MDSRRYRRYFVILEGAEEGFESRKNKKPKGYAKIETRNGKGVLNCYVQNLKYFEEAEWIYRGYLIGTKKEKPIYMQTGVIVIDQDGKGELNWKFDVENVDGRGSSFDDFNVIAVIAEKADRGITQEINAPLVGFIDKRKTEWKHVFKEEVQKEQAQTKEPSKEEVERSSIQKEAYHEGLVPQTKERVESDLEGKKTEMPSEKEEIELLRQEAETGASETVEEEEKEEKWKQEDKNQKAEAYAPADAVEKGEELLEKDKENKEMKQAALQHQEVEKDSEERTREDIEKAGQHSHDTKAFEGEEQAFAAGYTGEEKDSKEEVKQEFAQKTAGPGYQSQYFKMVCEYIQNVLKYYPKVEPFEKNIEGCNWWKISCNHQTLYRQFMPFYGYMNHMRGYPYANYMASCSDLIYKYQHYIFGIQKDEQGEIVHYLYGVPGRFLLSEQPDQGMTGFVYWHPMEDKTAERGDYGYWILHIDSKTGNVVMPLKPTPPPH